MTLGFDFVWAHGESGRRVIACGGWQVETTAREAEAQGLCSRRSTGTVLHPVFQIKAVLHDSVIVNVSWQPEKDTFMRTLIVAVMLCVTSATALPQDAAIDYGNEKSWPALVQDRRVTISEDDSELVTVMKKRHNASLTELRNRFTYWLQGVGTLESVCDNLDRFRDSHRDIGGSRAGDLQLQKDKLAFAESVHKHATVVLKSKNRTINAIDVHFARYYALHAKVELLQMGKQSKAR